MNKEMQLPKRRSMSGEVFVRFLRKPIAVLGALIIIIVALLCFLSSIDRALRF